MARSVPQWSFMMWVTFEQDMLSFQGNRLLTGCCVSPWGKGNLNLAITQVQALGFASYIQGRTQHSDLVMFSEGLVPILLSCWSVRLPVFPSPMCPLLFQLLEGRPAMSPNRH